MNKDTDVNSSRIVFAGIVSNLYGSAAPSYIARSYGDSPMSIWVELMLNALPSKAIDFVIPVIACLVAVYANACGRGANAAIEPLLMIRPRRMKPPSIGTSA